MLNRVRTTLRELSVRLTIEAKEAELEGERLAIVCSDYHNADRSFEILAVGDSSVHVITDRGRRELPLSEGWKVFTRMIHRPMDMPKMKERGMKKLAELVAASLRGAA